MQRSEVIRRLGDSETALRARGVTALALFGSLARGSETEASDIDVLVDLEDSRRFSLLDLADLLHCNTDVVIRGNATPTFLTRATAEEVPVF